jgi:hypothetical protein
VQEERKTVRLCPEIVLSSGWTINKENAMMTAREEAKQLLHDAAAFNLPEANHPITPRTIRKARQGRRAATERVLVVRRAVEEARAHPGARA